MSMINPSEKEANTSIKKLISELCSFNRNDLLVQLNEGQILPLISFSNQYHLPLDAALSKIQKVNFNHFRETGSNLICVSYGTLDWIYKENSTQTPFFLFPVEARIDKVKQELVLELDVELGLINPFLLRHFATEYDIDLSEFLNPQDELEKVEAFLKEKGFAFSFQPNVWLGNFHHHRFEILRDLEGLDQSEELNPNISELLQYEFSSSAEKIPLSSRLLLPTDDDQMTVLQDIANENLVVQGPPGTGKSQLIANLLGKTLYGGNNTLVLSEKRVALEVVKNRLREANLQHFAFLPEKEYPVHSLLKQLKENWVWMEEFSPQSSFNLDLSEQHLDALQMKLDILMKEDLIGGVSFANFKELLNGRSLTEASYNGTTPSIVEYLDRKPFIVKLYALSLQELSRYIPQSLLDEDRYVSLESNIRTLEKKWHELKTQFEFDTKKELAFLMKQASFAQMMSNELHQSYFKCLNPNKSEFNRFSRQYKKILKVKKEIELRESQKANWKVQPSKEETLGILETLEKGNFFQKFRVKKKLKQLLVSRFVDPAETLKKWLNYLKLVQEKLEIESKLLNLGVRDERQLDWVNALQLKIKKEDFDLWRTTTVFNNSLLANHNADLHIFYQNLRVYINMEDEDSLDLFFQIFNNTFPRFIKYRADLRTLSEVLYKQLGQVSEPEQLELSVLKSNWYKFIGQFTSFEKFQMSEIHGSIEEIIQKQNQEFIDFSEKIKYRIHSRWQQYHKLLMTGTKKLKKEERLLKEQLKRGRSILIKEFGKTKSHPTMRELLESDAKNWIDVLLPVWMLNPMQVAHYFPIESNRFGFLLVDEATQVSLAHSLGAIQRSKRIMVVGDSEQMTPQFYFKSGDSEPIDLLHQASFTWKKHMLKHHYRSENPRLIAFSNKHFYHDQLIAYPSPKQEKHVIRKHYVPNGVFHERSNVEEAKVLVQTLRSLLTSDEKIGVVAFSESQLECIYSLLSEQEKISLYDKIEEDKLFFKALENVQGDECDRLLVSLGYAPNEEGKLLLNFGPLNRKSGRRRLNVLLTRARKSIDFFTSITAEDLEISQNDTVNLLRQYFLFMDGNGSNKLQFPYGIKVKKGDKKDSKEIVIDNVFTHIEKASELVTFHRVLEGRGWKIRYS